MIIGVGTDLIKTERVSEAANKIMFSDRVFTSNEQHLIRDKKSAAADNWAAKEAVAKALGTGFNGFGPIDIEVLRDESRKPYVTLRDGAYMRAVELGITSIEISITNEGGFSAAVAIASNDEPKGIKSKSVIKQRVTFEVLRNLKAASWGQTERLADNLTHALQNDCTDEELLSKFPARADNVNKGSCGKVLVIAGSFKMAGAAIFSARAAYRTGSGLVKVYTDVRNRSIIQETLPEALFASYEDELEKAIEWADSIVIGPGLGSSESNYDILSMVLNLAKCPVIIDADALRTLADNMRLMEKAFSCPNVILTPHIKEMAEVVRGSRGSGFDMYELMGVENGGIKDIIEIIKSDNIRFAAAFAGNTENVLVLKDYKTITARAVVQEESGERSVRAHVNTSGNSGMATGGSGDVLTGIIASLAARMDDVYEAARLGVFLHGLAGDLAADRFGRESMMASDIIEALPDIIKRI